MICSGTRRCTHTNFSAWRSRVSRIYMYGDILLYPVALLRHLGLPMVLCYQLYVVLINILTAVLAYHTARTIAQSRGIALLACSIWTLSPYRLTDVYVRASVGEYTALSFIPAIILGLYFIFYATEDTTKRPWLWLAVGASGVVLSHIISVLIVTIAVVIPFIVLLIKRHDRFVWSQLIKSLLRILGISLFFSYPVPRLLQYEQPSCHSNQCRHIPLCSRTGCRRT